MKEKIKHLFKEILIKLICRLSKTFYNRKNQRNQEQYNSINLNFENIKNENKLVIKIERRKIHLMHMLIMIEKKILKLKIKYIII